MINAPQEHPANASARESRRLVIFCGQWPSPSTVEAVEAIADAHPDWQILILQNTGRGRRLGPFLKSKFRRLAREPLSYPLELLTQAMASLGGRKKRHVGASVRLPSLSDMRRGNVRYHAAESIHDEAALAVVREYRPWLGISLGAPVLKPSLFEIPELGTINVHKSFLPNYRGMPPGFWELHDGQDFTGVSVHWVAAGLDTGDIVAQERVAIPPNSMPESIGPLLDERTGGLLLGVLEELDKGRRPGLAQGPSQTPTRSRPAFLLARRVRHRLARKRSPVLGAGGRLRSLVKTAVLAAYVYAWAPVRNFVNSLRGKAHVTILLYHRVDDAYLDGISVGLGQFNEQMRCLGRHYDILDMPEFLASRGRQRRRPAVVITFDDGYESVHLAARLLRRQGIPATFFVSTRIVGTERGFPHDLQKLGKVVPSLSWPQVMDMNQWGFHIGPHTGSHANVGKIPLEEAKEEIRISVDDLRERLGPQEPQKWFSYPYGKASDISPTVRVALEHLGIEHCLSAYGGVNPPDFDPLDIKRQGVDWKFSLLALRAVVEGWRIR